MTVLHFDSANGNDALATKALSGSPTDIWVTFDFRATAACLAALGSGSFTGDYILILNQASAVCQGINVYNDAGTRKFWMDYATTGPWSSITGDTYVALELHIAAGSPCTSELFVNGTTVGAANDSGNTATSFSAIKAGGYFPNAADEWIIRGLKVGTTRGGSDLWNPTFGATVAPPFDSTSVGAGQTLETITDPAPPAPAGPEGVSIAFNDDLLEPTPTWERIDNQVRVSRWEIRRGRQDEREKTGTGEATVFVHDVDGFLDPSNTDSPWFGLLDGKQIALCRWHPIDEVWEPRFRGSIESYEYELHGSQVVTDVAIRAVGFMDYEANAEMAPGVSGQPGGRADTVFYDEQEVNDRINAIHSDAGLPPELYVTFSGNVVVQESTYDGGYSYLAGVQDAADAEFPGVANVYEDRYGRVVFHGRHARFDPDAVAADAGTDAWDFHRWKVGDGAAIVGDTDYAQARPPLSSDRSLKNVINAALVTPLNVRNEDVAGQLVTDAVSIGKYGVRSWTAQDLRVLEHKTNGNTALQECFNVGSYYVTNMAEPVERPRQITLRSLQPADPRASATWDVICRVDIADVVHLKVSKPGGGGFDDDYYVEGITESSTPLGPFTPDGAQYDLAEVVLDVSPSAWYTEDTFFGDDTPS